MGGDGLGLAVGFGVAKAGSFGGYAVSFTDNNFAKILAMFQVGSLPSPLTNLSLQGQSNSHPLRRPEILAEFVFVVLAATLNGRCERDPRRYAPVTGDVTPSTY